MAEIHQDQHRGGNQRHTHEAVGDSAMMLQSGDGAFEFPKHVDVSSLSGQYHRQCREGALAIEACASHARASQKMSERVQVFPRVVLGTARELLYAGASWLRCKGLLVAWRVGIVMHGFARQQIERVGQNLDDGQQRFRGPGWAARQVEDERALTNTANTRSEERRV